MEGAQRDHQEDHLEEGDEDVGGRDYQADDSKDRRDGTLDDGEAEAVKAVPHPLVRAALAVQVVVGNVSREVYGKSEKRLFWLRLTHEIFYLCELTAYPGESLFIIYHYLRYMLRKRNVDHMFKTLSPSHVGILVQSSSACCTSVHSVVMTYLFAILEPIFFYFFTVIIFLDQMNTNCSGP